MWLVANISLFLVLFSSISPLCYCQSQQQQISKTIVVNLDGHGDFSSIQAAVDSVPDFNSQWIEIRIRPGVYKEKVSIGANKGFIILEGEAATVIEWGEFVDSVSELAMWSTGTFYVQAHNVILSSITFKNTHTSTTDVKRAMAAIIGGDNTSVYGCSFIGVQDTLADLRGKHYFKNCYIEGAIDYIFGSGQSIYEGCVLKTVSTSAGVSYVTAQARNSSEESSGFVFKSCSLTGTATNTYLGRGYRDFSRVLFYQTYMDNIVNPKGWESWNARDGGKFTTFAEHGCFGPGSETWGRVPWEKKLSESEADQLADISYVNEGGWLDRQPARFRY